MCFWVTSGSPVGRARSQKHCAAVDMVGNKSGRKSVTQGLPRQAPPPSRGGHGGTTFGRQPPPSTVYCLRNSNTNCASPLPLGPALRTSASHDLRGLFDIVGPTVWLPLTVSYILHSLVTTTVLISSFIFSTLALLSISQSQVKPKPQFPARPPGRYPAPYPVHADNVTVSHVKVAAIHTITDLVAAATLADPA